MVLVFVYSYPFLGVYDYIFLIVQDKYRLIYITEVWRGRNNLTGILFHCFLRFFTEKFEFCTHTSSQPHRMWYLFWSHTSKSLLWYFLPFILQNMGSYFFVQEIIFLSLQNMKNRVIRSSFTFMNLNSDQWNCDWNGQTDETNTFIIIPLLIVYIYVEKPGKLGINQLKTYLQTGRKFYEDEKK